MGITFQKMMSPPPPSMPMQQPLPTNMPTSAGAPAGMPDLPPLPAGAEVQPQEEGGFMSKVTSFFGGGEPPKQEPLQVQTFEEDSFQPPPMPKEFQGKH
jgi:hypothetical protein